MMNRRSFFKALAGTAAAVVLAPLARAAEAIAVPATPSPWFPTRVPNGYLLADGRAVSRLQYKELFAALGTEYGSGDGPAR